MCLRKGSEVTRRFDYIFLFIYIDRFGYFFIYRYRSWRIIMFSFCNF